MEPQLIVESCKRLRETNNKCHENCVGKEQALILVKDGQVELRSALTGLLDMYTELVNSGDCGNWDPEKDNEVITARKALR